MAEENIKKNLGTIKLEKISRWRGLEARFGFAIGLAVKNIIISQRISLLIKHFQIFHQ
jgi:hypothetical protein